MIKKQSSLILLLLSALLALIQTIGATEDVTIKISTDQPGWTISKYLTGMHTVYGWERDAHWENPKLAEWMKSARVGTIRYPGGTAVQHWHWDDPNGINFKQDSWDPDYKGKTVDPKLWMGLDEYINFCRKVGAEPMVGINTLSGKKYKRRDESLALAKALIQHCKDRKYGVKKWYIGNECFIGWGPKGYARDIDDYARVLKQVDPDITIIGDWKFGPESKNRFAQAIEIVMLSQELDVMEIHEKYGLSDEGWGLRLDGHTSDTAKGWQQEAGLYDGKLDQYIELFYEKTKTREKPIKLAFNEWAAANETPYLSALTKADYLISMFKYPIYSACDWSMHLGKGAAVRFNKKSDQVKLMPAAEVFTMISAAQGQTHLPMTTTQKNVYGFAALQADKKTIQIYVLNKKSSSVDAEIELGDSKLNPGVSVQVSSLIDPGKVVKAAPEIVDHGEVPQIKLPPLSFSKILVSIQAEP